MLSLLFSPYGRISPREFLTGMVILGGVMAVCILSGLLNSGIGTLLQMLSVLLVIPFFFLAIKRSHDASRNGWFSVLWFILSLIVFLIVLAAMRDVFPMPVTNEIKAMQRAVMAETGFIGMSKMMGELPAETLLAMQREARLPAAGAAILSALASAALINLLNRRVGNNAHGAVA